MGEILIDDYTRRGYIDGRALRLPAVLVRPGGPNTAVRAGRAPSSASRSPAATMSARCDRTRAWPASRSGKVVQSFLHALALPSAEALGARRTRAPQRHPGERAGHVGRGDRPGRRARCASSPIRALQADHGRRARGHASRQAARQLGFPQSKDIDEIVREYEEAALAHHGRRPGPRAAPRVPARPGPDGRRPRASPSSASPPPTAASRPATRCSARSRAKPAPRCAKRAACRSTSPRSRWPTRCR